jgi:hypothetical protein
MLAPRISVLLVSSKRLIKEDMILLSGFPQVLFITAMKENKNGPLPKSLSSDDFPQ